VPGGLLLAWKRAGFDDERERALVAVAALGGGGVEIVPLPALLPGLEDHVLVAVHKEGRCGQEWPRPPAERKRRPW
jgi:hypothetical protein